MDRDHRPGSGINDAALGSANRPIQRLGDLLDQCGLTRLPRPGDHLNESTRLRQASSQFSGLGTLVIFRFTQCVEYFYSQHQPMQDHPLFGVLPAWLDLPINNAGRPGFRASSHGLRTSDSCSSGNPESLSETAGSQPTARESSCPPPQPTIQLGGKGWRSEFFRKTRRERGAGRWKAHG